MKIYKFNGNWSSTQLYLSSISHWKAKDFKNYFLYVLPIFLIKEKLNPTFNYLFDLRCGILKLLDNNLMDIDINQAYESFQGFNQGFISNFSEFHRTSNFHDLIHLPDMAKKSGALYNFSGFNFENINGILSKFCKGNKRFDLQIEKKLKLYSKIMLEASEWSDSNNIFYAKYFDNKMWKSRQEINQNSYIVGKTFNSLNEFAYSPCKKYFRRAIIKNLRYSCKEYDRDKLLSFSHLINNINKNIFIIEAFYSLKMDNMINYYATGKLYNSKYIEIGIYKIENQISTGHTEELSKIANEYVACNLFEDFLILNTSPEMY